MDYGGVPSIDDEANLESLYSKIDKIGGFWKSVKVDESLARYIPNLVPVSRQNQISGSIPRKAFASVTYLDMKISEFIIELNANTYSNYSSMELVLPIQFTKKKDIAIRQYPDDTRILPTNNNVDVYQYSASQLKYLPKNAISTIEKTSLYSKKPVYLDVDVDRRSNDNNDQK